MVGLNILTLSGTWKFRQVNTDEWMPAQVPGGVHTDLLAAGRIPDPFVADNEKHVQWVAQADWEYQHFFTVPSELLSEDHIFLVSDGLDTLATIILNDHQLGQANNMFRMSAMSMSLHHQSSLESSLRRRRHSRRCSIQNKPI